MKITFLLFYLIYFTGCGSDKFTLFQEKGTENLYSNKKIVYEYKIASQDRVSVTVSGHPELSTPIEGIKVSDEGVIEVELLKNVNVAGLTEMEASLLLENKLLRYVKEPQVKVKIVNKRAYILGEINSQGIIPFDGDHISLIEAISEKGGLTKYAELDNIKIIRGDAANPDVLTVDLTNINSVKTTKLVIRPNDIIYIQPNSIKSTSMAIESFMPALNSINSILSTFVSVKYLGEWKNEKKH